MRSIPRSEAENWFVNRPIEFRQTLNQKVEKLAKQNPGAVRSELQFKLICESMEKGAVKTILVGDKETPCEVVQELGFQRNQGCCIAVVRVGQERKVVTGPTRNGPWRFRRNEPAKSGRSRLGA